MLKKEEFTELESGWMSPEGEFFPCGYMEHFPAAEELCERVLGQVPQYPADRLMEMGWLQVCRILYGVKRPGFAMYFKGHLSDRQVWLIRPVAEDREDDIFNYFQLEKEFDR